MPWRDAATYLASQIQNLGVEVLFVLRELQHGCLEPGVFRAHLEQHNPAAQEC